MSSLKLWTVIIPTLNSERTIEICLKSIVEQSIGRENIEILVVDGGSNDKTIEIANFYGCKVLDNPHVQQEYGKYIGLINSIGKYVMFLDSDEVLLNKNSLEEKARFFEKYENVKMILNSGYISPKGVHPINDYINSIADPFAKFLYDIDCSYPRYTESIKKKVKYYEEVSEGIIIDFSKVDFLPLVDMAASNCIVREFVFMSLKEDLNNEKIIPLLFYKIVSKGGKVGMLKDHPVIHYSAENIRRYIRKLRWRVINNVHKPSYRVQGHVSIEEFLPNYLRMKKYLFPIYAISLVFPILDGIMLSIRHGKLVFILHPFFTLFITFNILFQYFLKLLGITPKLAAYGK